MVRGVFLDRDGTLNKKVHRPENPKQVAPWYYAEFELFDNLEEAIGIFRSMGYSIHVVTNQPDILDGYMTQDTLDMMHAYLKRRINYDTIQAAKIRGTEDYKPNPGMLNKIIREWHLDPKQCWMIGDTWKDIAAGINAGVKTLQVGNEIDAEKAYPYARAVDILEAAKLIEKLEMR